MSRQQQISNADSKKPKKNTRRSTAQHRRRTGTATPTHPSTSRQSYKAFDSISMFAAVERGTARTPWEFSIPRSSLENEGCTGARRQLRSPAIKSTPSARPRVTRGSALIDVVALVFPRHSGHHVPRVEPRERSPIPRPRARFRSATSASRRTSPMKKQFSERCFPASSEKPTDVRAFTPCVLC